MQFADFKEYVGAAQDACEQAGEGYETVFVVSQEDHETIMCLGIETGNPNPLGVMAQLDQMMAARPFFAGMASRVSWSPDEGPTGPSWLLVCVDPERDATFLVRRDVDGRWWRLGANQVPWFALSTASSLRDAMISGEPLKMKSAANKPDLFKRPDQNPNPSQDPDGLL